MAPSTAGGKQYGEPESVEDEAPKHWAGDARDEEIQGHHSSVFLRVVGSMQLAAIGLHGWVAGAGCCCCLPIKLGVQFICVILLTRGILALTEFPFDNERIIFASKTLDWENPFVHLAQFMLAVGGLGDVVAAVCGGFGATFQRVMPTFVLPLWLFVHTLFSVLFTMIIATLDTIGIGGGWTIFFSCIFLVGPDIYFLFISLQNLLLVTWQGTVAPSMVEILYESENIAVQYGSTVVSTSHLIAALLKDTESRQLLEYGGVEVDKMTQDLRSGTSFLAGEKYMVEELLDSHDPLPFGPDATMVLAEAAREQWKAYEPRLTADHLLLALTSGGTIVLQPMGKQLEEVNGRIVAQEAEPSLYPVPHAKEMRDWIEDAHREHSTEPGPPPALVFGCLPVEECVIGYIALQVLLCFMSVFCILFLGRSLGVMAGLRTVMEMRLLELLASSAGFILGILALIYIFGHRRARIEIRIASLSAGGRWAAELDDAWITVRTSKQAPVWLDQLKAGATYLSYNLAWNVVQLFVDVPVFLGVLVFGNVCSSYDFGLLRASSTAPCRDQRLTSLAPMHCTNNDLLLIGVLVTWIVLKFYMCWSQLALWHEYAYGWTTTEFRGAAYLDPFLPIAKDKIRLLAGLPKVAQKRLSDTVDENTPLIL